MDFCPEYKRFWSKRDAKFTEGTLECTINGTSLTPINSNPYFITLSDFLNTPMANGLLAASVYWPLLALHWKFYMSHN